MIDQARCLAGGLMRRKSWQLRSNPTLINWKIPLLQHPHTQGFNDHRSPGLIFQPKAWIKGTTFGLNETFHHTTKLTQPIWTCTRSKTQPCHSIDYTAQWTALWPNRRHKTRSFQIRLPFTTSGLPLTAFDSGHQQPANDPAITSYACTNQPSSDTEKTNSSSRLVKMCGKGAWYYEHCQHHVQVGLQQCQAAIDRGSQCPYLTEGTWHIQDYCPSCKVLLTPGSIGGCTGLG